VSRCGDPRVYEVLDEALGAARRGESAQAAHAAL
jgi:hypothetical protein